MSSLILQTWQHSVVFNLGYSKETAQSLGDTKMLVFGTNPITGGQPVTFQQSPFSFQGTGNVGFQQFPGGGAVGAGGAAGNPLGFPNSVFGQFGMQLPAGIPSTGGTGSPGTGIGTGGTPVGTRTGGCPTSVCG